jgi:hypothetical protein
MHNSPPPQSSVQLIAVSLYEKQGTREDPHWTWPRTWYCVLSNSDKLIKMDRQNETIAVHAWFEVLTAVIMRSSTLWNKMAFRALKINDLSEENAIALLASCFVLVSFLATCSSDISVDFQRTTRLYIPEDRTLHSSSILSHTLLHLTSGLSGHLSCLVLMRLKFDSHSIYRVTWQLYAILFDSLSQSRSSVPMTIY